MTDTVELSYSERDNAGTSARTINDANGPKKAKGKIDIIMPNKTNKTPLLVSY